MDKKPENAFNQSAQLLSACFSINFWRELRQQLKCVFDMKPVMDLDERPGKVVGKIRPHPASETLDRMVGRFHAMGLKLPFPKGVFRFKTFEEADAWEMKHRIAAAVKRLRDHQH
ncbi:MAG: hypothetical protein C5B50_20175 [Verrucomicrobia bacterium]|nr:MAG: hypothetical protein C5B50_20175 [Verrucomicrobiota bacterium]